MPIKARREKQRKEFRETILRHALEIAEAEGWQHVTIRKLCDKLQYTAPVVYQYFDSKEHILQSIRHRGLEQVIETFQHLDAKKKTAEQRMIAYGLFWWEFALKNPSQYQVMYNLQGVRCKQEDFIEPATQIDQFYYAAFVELIGIKKSDSTLLRQYCDHWIALIHGFVALHMVQKLRSGRQAKTAYTNALKRFLASIKLPISS